MKRLVPRGVEQQPRPNPRRLSEPLYSFEVERMQRVNCRLRGVCVTHAARQGANGWPGFHCNDCAVDEPMSPEQMALDNEGVGASAIARELAHLILDQRTISARKRSAGKR